MDAPAPGDRGGSNLGAALTDRPLTTRSDVDATPDGGSDILHGLRAASVADTMGSMLTHGIRAFLTRDWQRARDAKDAYWAERVQRLGPLEALRISDELRRQALLQHPDWPDAASRRDDLRHHVRMTELFARVDSAERRPRTLRAGTMPDGGHDPALGRPSRHAEVSPEPELLGHPALPPVERDEPDVARCRHNVERAGNVPQIGAPQVARVQDGFQLGSQRSVREHPL